MTNFTASTLLGSKTHTTMYHDTIIVFQHSVRYRNSFFYSLVTLSKSSYLYIDFAICLQYAYKLAIHKYLPISSHLLFLLLLYCSLTPPSSVWIYPVFFILNKISWFTKLISNFWLAFRYSLTFIQVGLNLIENSS